MLLHILKTCIFSQAQKRKKLFIVKYIVKLDRKIFLIPFIIDCEDMSFNKCNEIEKVISKGLKPSQDENKEERRAKREK